MLYESTSERTPSRYTLPERSVQATFQMLRKFGTCQAGLDRIPQEDGTSSSSLPVDETQMAFIPQNQASKPFVDPKNLRCKG